MLTISDTKPPTYSMHTGPWPWWVGRGGCCALPHMCMHMYMYIHVYVYLYVYVYAYMYVLAHASCPLLAFNLICFIVLPRCQFVHQLWWLWRKSRSLGPAQKCNGKCCCWRGWSDSWGHERRISGNPHVQVGENLRKTSPWQARRKRHWITSSQYLYWCLSEENGNVFFRKS